MKVPERNKRKITSLLLFLVACSFCLFLACDKSRNGGSGGNATLSIYGYWKNPNAGNSMQPAPIYEVYIWYDGNNAQAIFQPRDLSTADTVCFGHSNENHVSIRNLRWGNYAWVLFSKAPGMWKTYTAQGSTFIPWKSRKKEKKLEVELF